MKASWINLNLPLKCEIFQWTLSAAFRTFNLSKGCRSPTWIVSSLENKTLCLICHAFPYTVPTIFNVK